MAWASERHTSRAKDEASCLLGLFEINIPLLYGKEEELLHRKHLARATLGASGTLETAPRLGFFH